MAESSQTYESYPLRDDGKEWVVLLRNMQLEYVTARQTVRGTAMVMYQTHDDYRMIEGINVWEFGAVTREQYIEYQRAYNNQDTRNPQANSKAELYLLAYRFGLITLEQVRTALYSQPSYGESRLAHVAAAHRQQRQIEDSQYAMLERHMPSTWVNSTATVTRIAGVDPASEDGSFTVQYQQEITAARQAGVTQAAAHELVPRGELLGTMNVDLGRDEGSVIATAAFPPSARVTVGTPYTVASNIPSSTGTFTLVGNVMSGDVLPAGTPVYYDAVTGTVSPNNRNYAAARQAPPVEVERRAAVLTQGWPTQFVLDSQVKLESIKGEAYTPLPKVSTFILQSVRRRRITISAELK